MQEKTEANLKNLSIADRLTRRAVLQTTKVTLSDDLGEFTIELRQPTRRELDELLKFQREVQDPNKTEEASKQLYKTLGSLCCDESLNEQYWAEGDYNLNDLTDIINKLFTGFVERFQEVQKFRQDGSGAGIVPDVRVPGKTPA
jgi:hypothetical protein